MPPEKLRLHARRRRRDAAPAADTPRSRPVRRIGTASRRPADWRHVAPDLRLKRIKDLIWAADLLKVIRDDVHLADHRRRARSARLYHRFRRQVRIEDKVHLLGLRDDARRSSRTATSFGWPAKTTVRAAALVEAMAAGVPCVVSDTRGHRELVVDGRCGLLIRLGDRAGFARMANKLVDQPELARQLGEAGRARVAADFSAAAMVAAHAALYRELVARR